MERLETGASQASTGSGVGGSPRSDSPGRQSCAYELRWADLSRADLTGASFAGAKLYGAHLEHARLDKADFAEAHLDGAFLARASLRHADLRGASAFGTDMPNVDLTGATLVCAYLEGANLAGAVLESANLRKAVLRETNLAGSTLIRCNVYGTACWDVNLTGSTQQDLCVSPEGAPAVTVDNINLAQLIYLLLNNENFRAVIDTLTSKAVLILGRFTEERKNILYAIRNVLREEHGLLPILFALVHPQPTGTLRRQSNSWRACVGS